MRVDKGMVLAGLLLIGCGFVPPRPSTRSQAGGISGVSHPQLRGGGEQKPIMVKPKLNCGKNIS